MVRRTFWMLVGAGLGAWMVLRLQRAASRLTPGGAAEALRRQARHLGNDVAAAVAEGRRAKRATEHDLRHTARARPAIDAGARASVPSGESPVGHGLSPADPAEELPVRR